MGHGSSKEDDYSSSSSSDADTKPSRISRLKQRLRLHRHRHHRTRGSSSQQKLNAAEDFAGIALLTLINAEMKFKDKWLACVSFGEQTFRTNISDQTDKPNWNCERKLLLERNGPRVARISVFETNRLSKNNLIGYCDINLLDYLARDSDSDCEAFDLLDPVSSDVVVGRICLSCNVEDPIETEKNFARRILSIVDYNEDGMLSMSEFSDLINAFGNNVAASKKEELFKAADKNGDSVVSMDELAALLALQQEKEPIMNCCPVCGEIVEVSDKLNTVIHLTLCFDEGTGNQVMTGGFLTENQASYGWMFKLSEWAHFSSYDVGLNSGSSASHILVFDRKTKRLVEELIDAKIVLSMRAIYQSKIGLGLMDKGAKEILQSISERQGRQMNSVESAKDILKFVEFFKDQINMAEVKYPLDHFKTFNEFFVRELKPGARPIASLEHDDVAVCAADSRLMAFKSVQDSLRLWIKGRKFSIQGLLGKETCSSAFIDGTLVIFRLAPQDYHRFHFPVSGTVEQFVNIPGSLYTVNPIAVNSKYCNVFTENKRVVSIISTAEFGKVAFVAIGATMVGSITFVKKEGDVVKKGDEFGYFSFGGSTVICVFEKDAIKVDDDLLANSGRSLETLVSVGMTLGVSTKKPAGAELPNLESCVLGD
ncbi:PREDICTED: phosphatidylserine decarboxylase proenzyme 2 [Theobroma cacao]|uniref:Phosphatidylserine decarboxylase proenzyme 2 n=1 Tax=Theobroma cacao TaxID=3641 RepID=A0AB32VI81_THECC|nr:PREDICTED: phosphatidylserine decarboxylase proenzyme 2 [Theobroma cacao]